MKFSERLDEIFSQADDSYLELAKRYEEGDKGVEPELRKLVDSVAENNGYNLGPVYHGTTKRFTVFSNQGSNQLGFHFGNKKQAKNIRENLRKLFSLYISIKNPIELEDMGSWYGKDVVDMVNRLVGLNIHSSASSSYIQRKIREKGYDGVTYDNKFESEGVSYIVFKPTQIKSYNLITHDDSKNIIPLNKRFDKNNFDIRY